VATEPEVRRALEATWRIESGRIIAGLTRILRDVSLAEEIAQDAFVAALEQWPDAGVPDRPGAWLMAAAKHRAIDAIRHRAMRSRKHDSIAREAATAASEAAERLATALESAFDDPIGDDLLRLLFVACHPVLSRDARAALTLRLLAGLTTAEIARAFILPEATIAQRIVRAKRTLAEARVPFEVPPAELGQRLDSVLEVIYLLFNEGHAATAGEDWMRPALCEEALRLGRILASLAPAESGVHGLVALMEIQASRLRARLDADGEPILLLDQDRARWDRLLIGRGLAALDRSERLAAAGSGLGRYALQAAIAACHARAVRAEATDWPRIVALYDALAELGPSPVVDLNRAVAVAMAYGPDAGLPIVDRLQAEGSLASYHLLPSVRGDLLSRMGRAAEAAAEFDRAAALAGNAIERELLTRRAAACRDRRDA
jgi:RNA polymerase sigma factor (sigma-70 family)